MILVLRSKTSENSLLTNFSLCLLVTGPFTVSSILRIKLLLSRLACSSDSIYADSDASFSVSMNLVGLRLTSFHGPYIMLYVHVLYK